MTGHTPWREIRHKNQPDPWPPEDVIEIRLRLRDAAGTSYLTPASTRELVTRLRELQTAMGSAQLVAKELARQAELDPAERVTVALFGEQAKSIIEAIDSWERDTPLPDDVDKLRTALLSTD